jgi:hypothetical protein
VFVGESVSFDGQGGLHYAQITDADSIFVDGFLQTG